MIERIERVINNHQLSCQNTDKYFYILRGFDEFIDDIALPMKHVTKETNPLSNRYALESELSTLEKSKFDGFKLIEIIFNLFKDNQIYENGQFKNLGSLDLEIHDTLHIFNQIDQLKDISDQDLDNNERLHFAKDTLHKEVKE